LVLLRRELVEKDANGLIEFIEPRKRWPTSQGQEKGKNMVSPGHRIVAAE